VSNGLYRLTEPTIAVIMQNGRYVTHEVPAGTLITIVDETISGNRLISVMWDGLEAMMFAQDLQTRTTKEHSSEASA